MPMTLPSDVPLRVMLEQRRLTHRDRRLRQVLGVLRTRADVQKPPPRSLLHAIDEFSRERAALRRRLHEIERADAALRWERAVAIAEAAPAAKATSSRSSSELNSTRSPGPSAASTPQA